MIKAVIFDLDGVLVSTDELHYRAWSRLADEEGIPFSRQINHRQRGISRMESLEVLLERAPRTYTAAEKTALAERKNSYYRQMLATLKPSDALPGARELLRALRARGIKTAVASASTNTSDIMRNVDLFREVDAVADGNEITRTKPDPEVFLLAARKLGIEPGDCLVVEDAKAGIEAGRRAGMAVFAVGPRELHSTEPRWAESLAEVTPDELLNICSGHATADPTAAAGPNRVTRPCSTRATSRCTTCGFSENVDAGTTELRANE